jgi:hypothetical protein
LHDDQQERQADAHGQSDHAKNASLAPLARPDVDCL